MIFIRRKSLWRIWWFVCCHEVFSSGVQEHLLQESLRKSLNLSESRKPAREFGKERLTGPNKLKAEVQALFCIF